MRPADRDDMQSTSDVDRPTVRIGDLYPEEDESSSPPRSHHPRRRLTLPLVIFLVLLAAAAVVGRFVVPSLGSTPQAATKSATPTPTGLVPPIAVTPSLPDLPTPPPRPADGLASWAAKIAAVTDIPPIAAEAYGYAQLLLQRLTPNCHLGWTTLAAIGKVESDHGRTGGATLAANGRSTPPIIGPALDGKAGRALVADSDAGAYDADATYDRMMGPMHLLPSVWAVYRIDADGDSILDPYDIDDASAALGRYLCSGTENLETLSGWKTALARYHAGDPYERAVFQAADSYGQLTRSIG
jgi:hypothetical protein